MKPLWITLFLPFFASLAIPTAQYSVQPQTPVLTEISGKDWAYTVPFPVKNIAEIEKLIQCESQGVNVARPDSNHKISWGVLQFNGTSTWDEMETKFDFYGSPMVPADAIHMADMMISNGLIARWTCARLTGLIS
ncbi:MAG TPA: hypothetical protein VKR52_04760 [Terracidiphilus sp.]|nr:hypothetical protein [Terracidiphilus sp.]